MLAVYGTVRELVTDRPMRAALAGVCVVIYWLEVIRAAEHRPSVLLQLGVGPCAWLAGLGWGAVFVMRAFGLR